MQGKDRTPLEHPVLAGWGHLKVRYGGYSRGEGEQATNGQVILHIFSMFVCVCGFQMKE